MEEMLDIAAAVSADADEADSEWRRRRPVHRGECMEKEQTTAPPVN
jgi:hypothetical protein